MAVVNYQSDRSESVLVLKISFTLRIDFNAQQFALLVSRSKDKNMRKINVGWRKTLRVRN